MLYYVESIPEHTNTSFMSSGNFWQSSHCQRWLFETNDVDLTRQHALLPHIDSLKRATLQLRIKSRILCSAVVFMRRFYHKHTFEQYNPLLIAPACLLVASKAEEHLIYQKDIVQVMQTDQLDHQLSTASLTQYELIVLNALNGDLVVHQPHSLVLELLADCQQQSCTDAAFRFCNDIWLLTPAALIYPPHVVAVAACRMAFSLHSISDEAWFAKMAVRPEHCRALIQSVCRTYELIDSSIGR